MNALSAPSPSTLARLDIQYFWVLCTFRYLYSALSPTVAAVSGLTESCPTHAWSSAWPKTWDKSPSRFLLLYPFATLSPPLPCPINLSPLRPMKMKTNGCCNTPLRFWSYLLHSQKGGEGHNMMLVILTGPAEHITLSSNTYNSYYLGKLLLSSKIQFMTPPLWSLQD